MIEIRNNGQDSMRVESRRVGGILVEFIATRADVNEALEQDDVNLQNLSLKVKLDRRDGSGRQIINETIFNGDALQAAFAGTLKTAAFDQFSPATSGDAGWIVRQNEAVGAVAVGMKAFVLPFGSPVDCDYFNTVLTIEAQSTEFFSTDINNAASYIYVSPIYTQAPEKWIPRIECEYIQANKNSYQKAYTGVLSEFAFLNTDKTTVLSTARVLLGVDIDSDDWSEQYDNDDLQTLRLNQFETLTSANGRLQSFSVVPFNADKFKRQTKVSLTLDAANVTASKNIVVAWVGVPSRSSVEAFANYQEKASFAASEIGKTLQD